MPDRRTLASLIAAVALISAVLVLPNQLGALVPAAFRRFPLELPLILVLLAAAPARAARPLRAGLAALLAAAIALKLVDLASEAAFQRPFNPVFDAELVPAAWHLASGAIGRPLAFAAVLALAGALGGVAWALWLAAGHIARLRAPWLAALALPALVIVGLDASGVADPPGRARTTRMVWEHVRDIGRAQADLDHFRAEAAADPNTELPPAAVLSALRGTDVFVIFLESYGRAAVANPRYGPGISARLRAVEAEIAAAGLAARSGFLTAPMVGGQSWLAHASLLSGLAIDSQGRYRALVESPRRTLLHLAQSAGWRTAAVMPAITFDWPEARYFGYDRVLAAADLGYDGPSFGWATPPDQFTLAAFERALLGARPRAPIFAEIALISSHAPWTPVPPLLPWATAGDGQAYPEPTDAPAEAVWRDPERMRAQYLRSLKYGLSVVGGFAARRAADPPLIVLLGDHQAAPFVSGGAGGRDVPGHLIGTPETLAHVDRWGWTPGMVPDAAVPAWDMHSFRDRFLDAFGAAPERQSAAKR